MVSMKDKKPDECAVASVSGHVRSIRDGMMLVVLVSSAPCMALMFTALGPVLPGIASHYASFGDSALVAQMVMTMPGIGIIVGGPLMGWLVERFGARLLLFFSLGTYSIAGSAGLYLDAIVVLLASRLMVGVAASGVATSALSIIAAANEEMRARILGYQGAAGAAFGLLSLLIAGGIGESFGWRAPFSLYLLALLILFIAFMIIPATQTFLDEQEKLSAGEHPLLSLWPIYLLIMLLFMAVFMNAVQLPFLLAQNSITSPKHQSWIMATSSLSSMIGAGAYGWIRARIAGRRIFMGCLACMGVGFITMGATHEVVLTTIGCALSALGGGCAGPCLAMILLDRTSASVRGRASGFMYTAIFLGEFLNPLFLNPIRTGLGIHAAFLVVGGLLAVSALIVGIVTFMERQDGKG